MYNFSKAILDCALVKDGSSTLEALLWQEIFTLYNLLDYKNSTMLVSNEVLENKGEVDKWIDEIER